MAIDLKTADEIEKMRIVGALAARQLEMIEQYIEPGVSTGELDRICHDFTVNEQHAIPAPLNYRGFPKSICTSVNHVVCHGIPSDDKILKNGDIINVDVTLIKNEYHGDTSKTFMVGKPNVLAERLTKVAKQCLYRGIRAVVPGATLGDIGHAVHGARRRSGHGRYPRRVDQQPVRAHPDGGRRQDQGRGRDSHRSRWLDAGLAGQHDSSGLARRDAERHP